jgi:hypothetical protein
MAGDTLTRPLFKRGPQGEMRPQMLSGGIFNPKNWRFPFPRPGHQYEMFKYGENVPVSTIDELGDTKTINTQTITPKKRFDINANIWGQDMDNMFYSQPKKGPGTKPLPITETTPGRTETDLFGNTINVGGETKINWGNLYNAPFTNFGTIKQRWKNLSPERRKMIIRNLWGQPTVWAIVPAWMKETPEAQAVTTEETKQDIISTLEEQGLPTPALSYEEATTFGPEGDPSVVMAGMEEYADISDKEINQKKKELKEEREILNPEPVDPGGRMEEFADLSQAAGREGADDMGAGEGGTMFDLISAYLGEDTEVDAKGIEETKAELKSLMGDDSKMMNTMMLMQLGLGMMTNTTSQSGIRGFLDVAGQTGNQILPIAMQNLKDKSKMDKELALAAYDIVREERAAKTARMTDIQDFYIKEMIKKEFEGNEPKGTLRTVMKKNVVTLPDGQEFTSWTPIDQVFDKGERAAWYMEMSRMGNEEMGVLPGDIRISSDLDAAAASAGNDPYQGDLTASQRGEHLALASVFEAALPDALNIQMNPQYGLYSGNLATGTAGGIEKWLRTAARESKQLADNLGIPWLSDYFENTGKASLASLDVQMNKGMIFSGSMANKASNFSTGDEDLYVGEGMGPDGVMIQGEWATDAYVKNLINNPTLDVAEQMQNRMGFLAARLKQPTGRLLADTIRRSIDEVKMLGLGAGDPQQVSHRLHQFTKDLYQQYVKHSLLGGTHITESWAVDPGVYGKDRITIKDYQDGYYNFIGGSQNSPNLPIDMSWVQIDGRIKSSAPPYSSTSSDSIDVKGPINFFKIYEKYNPGGNQTFGGKEFTGAQ